MLANNLTLDDEEAVQEELLALQQNIVRIICGVWNERSLSFQALEEAHAIELPDAPVEQPASSVKGKTEIHIVIYFSILTCNNDSEPEPLKRTAETGKVLVAG